MRDELRRGGPQRGCGWNSWRFIPAPLVVAAHPAMPILGIGVGTRQQLVGARRFNHGDGTIGPGLCALGVERHKEVQTFAGVGVQRVKSAGFVTSK